MIYLKILTEFRVKHPRAAILVLILLITLLSFFTEIPRYLLEELHLFPK